jgi:hypothetical protein
VRERSGRRRVVGASCERGGDDTIAAPAYQRDAARTLELTRFSAPTRTRQQSATH